MTSLAAAVLATNDLVEPTHELELTILIPCLNEAETIAIVIGKALGYLKRSGISGEVLISDNGSTDGSIEIAEGLGARVVRAPVRGYGGALGHGIAEARGRYVIMGDADDSYDFSDLSAFVAELRQGKQLVMGNRFKGGIAPKAMPWLHRYLGNPVLSAIGRLFFNIPVGDFHCGLRGFDRAAIEGLGLRTTGMEFASEMVVFASLHGLSIAEVPTGLAKDGRSRPPHLNTWRDGWRHLRFLLLHSPRWMFGYPGAAMIGFGLAMMLALSSGPLVIAEGISLDVRAYLIGCLSLILGVQALTFGIISRRYAKAHQLLPGFPRAQRLLDAVSLERMLQLGAVIGLIGVGGVVSAIDVWASSGFGAISGGYLLRGVMASVSMIVIAVQIAFSAFLLGVLEMRPNDARGQQQKLRVVFPDA